MKRVNLQSGLEECRRVDREVDTAKSIQRRRSAPVRIHRRLVMVDRSEEIFLWSGRSLPSFVCPVQAAEPLLDLAL